MHRASRHRMPRHTAKVRSMHAPQLPIYGMEVKCREKGPGAAPAPCHAEAEAMQHSAGPGGGGSSTQSSARRQLRGQPTPSGHVPAVQPWAVGRGVQERGSSDLSGASSCLLVLSFAAGAPLPFASSTHSACLRMLTLGRPSQISTCSHQTARSSLDHSALKKPASCRSANACSAPDAGA